MDAPSFYAVITAEVRYDKNLTPNAKLLYGEITALCNQKGFCRAGDKYFEDLYNVSRSTVQSWLNSLEECGYIEREVQYEEGTKKIVRRIIKINTLCQKSGQGMPEIWTTPMPEIWTVNNTILNNTYEDIYTDKNFTFESDVELDLSGRSGVVALKHGAYGPSKHELDLEREKSSAKKEKAPPEFVGPRGVFKCTEEQLEDFYKKYGKVLIDDYIGRVEDYCLSKGKKYKDYPAALRNFLRSASIKPRKL